MDEVEIEKLSYLFEEEETNLYHNNAANQLALSHKYVFFSNVIQDNNES